MSLTPDQARAAHAGGSVAVVAGAGTGKTHMLAGRYLHHLGSGLSPLEVVAVTFTEKAAAELRARIRAEVARRLPERPDALVELEAAQISTLHALAARICRDHPEAAGVPPDFVVLDDLEAAIWEAGQFEEALAGLPAEVFAHLPYARLEGALARLLEDPVPAAEALAVPPGLWADLAREAREAARRRVVELPDWQAAVATLTRLRGPAEDRGEQARLDALAAVRSFSAGAAAAAREHVGRYRSNAGRSAAWGAADLQVLRDALGTIKRCIADACDDGLVLLETGPADEALAVLLPEMRAAFEQVGRHLAAARRRARVLDFADLEAYALRALEHASVREHYAARWRAVLIDEFQDTNPVQARLLDALTEGLTVTVVGDEKQAIYGFRGADVGVFRSYRERLGHEVVLAESFRGHAPLLALLNATFAPILADLHQPLSAFRREAPHPGPFVRAQVVSAERGTTKGRRQVTAARALGLQLAALLEEGLPVFDKATGGLRPLRPDDVAVLTRTWGPLQIYGEILPALGVPAVHTGGGNLLETREAKDGLALVRFLADPSDDLALVGLLRSPFFAMDDRALQAFAGQLPQGRSWWENLEETGPEAFARPRRLLARLLDARRESPPSRLLQLADALCGYGAVLANLPGAARREADWRGFLELLRALEAGSQDVFTVSRRLRTLLLAEAEVERPTLQADGAVSLLTIHRAKGLEWPLVAVADLDYTPRGRSPAVLHDPRLGAAMQLEDDGGEVQTPVLYTLLQRRERAREEAEARRLLYVALTRARDGLLLSATQERGGLLDLLRPGLEAAGIPLETIAHDPEAAVYPDAPLPPRSDGPDDGLWTFGVATGPGTDAAHPPDPWDEVLFLVGEMDETWLSLARALREDGVPAPDPDTVFRELTEAGRVTAYPAVMQWARPGPPLALVEEAVPDGHYDQELLRADPTGEVADQVPAVLAALGLRR